MTCRELIEFLLEYLEGGLTPAERAVFDEHLAECPSCVDYLGMYEDTIRLSKGAFAAPPEKPPEDLVRAILAARGGGPAKT
jgi:anti-sigma factor RsiW